MINFIQLNQNIVDWETNIITDVVWETIHGLLNSSESASTENLLEYIQEVSIQYNMDKKNIIKQYFHYILYNQTFAGIVTTELLDIIEVILHTSNDTDTNHLLKYFVHKLHHLYSNQNKKLKPI